MKTNRAGIELIKAWEGVRLTAYPDPATGGEPWTIGYGHTSAAGEPRVFKGMTIHIDEANAILERDLVKYEAAVSKLLKRNPNENQFSAMVSLCFNIGPGNMSKSSVVRLFNAGDIPGAANAFRMWNKAAGKVMKGLENRREAERMLFLRAAQDVTQPAPVDTAPHVPPAAETPPATSGGLLALILRIIAAIFGRK